MADDLIVGAHSLWRALRGSRRPTPCHVSSQAWRPRSPDGMTAGVARRARVSRARHRAAVRGAQFQGASGHRLAIAWYWPRSRLDDERHVPGVAAGTLAMEHEPARRLGRGGEWASTLSPDRDLAVLALSFATGGAGHARRSSASACSSQNRMSISWYIVAAVARCSRACSRWPVRRQSLPRPR
jgi:hypothetical protein